MMRSIGDHVTRRFIRWSSTVRIATLSPAGNPDIIPLYFVTYRGRVYMGTRSENPTVRDLMRNPEVALLFHAERRGRSRHVLRMSGRATFRTERSIAVPVSVLYVLKYVLSPGGIRSFFINRHKLALRGRYTGERGGGSGFIEVVPQSTEFLDLPR